MSLLFFTFAYAQPNHHLQAKLTDIRVQSSPSPQIILNIDKEIDYKVFTLPSPVRLVVDLSNTNFSTGAGKAIDFSGVPVTDYRHGIQSGYNLRLVFDLTKAAHYNVTTRKLISAKQSDYQILITFQDNAHSSVVSSPVKTALSTQKTLKNMADNAEDKSTQRLSSLPNLPKKEKMIIVIDAGHGGKDPGAKGPCGTMEKNVTLAIAKDLEALVNQEPNMKAVLTRKDDTYIGLRHRLAIARKAKGDMFVAIHADAFEGSDADGASVYALSLHGSSSEAALWLSQKENYSELGSIDLGSLDSADAEIRSVLIDLSQTATISASLKLGRDVLQQLGNMTDLHHDCVEQAPFMVLKSPDIPSILVETGFISNPEEEKRLKTREYQEKLANALMSGIKTYCQQSGDAVNSSRERNHSQTLNTRSVDET